MSVNDASNQSPPETLALLEESSVIAKPPLASDSIAVSDFPRENSEEAPARPMVGPGQAALFLDSTGNILAAQPRCADFFGRTPEELIDLNIQALLKPGMGQVITEALAKGRGADGISFHVLALRKDSSEFATHFAFKFLPGSAGSCWALFVQAPPGFNDGSHQKFMNAQINPNSVPDRGLQPIAANTETATGTGEAPAAGAAPLSETERLAAKLEAARAECERLARNKFEADDAANKRLRQVQLDYGKRITQLEQDLVAERQTNENLSQKVESLDKSLEEQTKGMRRIKQQLSEPAAMLDKTMTEIQELELKYNTLESEAAGLRQEREQLQGELARSQAAQQQALSQIADLTAKMEQTLRALAGLEKERAAGKLSQQKAEELNAQVETLRKAVEQAELRARENAAQSQDWEKKAADQKNTIEVLTRSHAADQSAAAAHTAQRVRELEQQLKGANDNLAASKTELEKQNSSRQQLESANRSLTEANAKAKADLDKERETINISRQEANNRDAQLQKLQQATEQAEARAREIGVRISDSEKRVADQKKSFDELARNHAAQQSALAHSTQRIKELEQQLRGANDNLTAGKAGLEKQSSARQQLESENRNLTEANAHVKGALDKERDANKTLRQEVDGLTAQLKKSQQGAEEAEFRARESAAQSKDWEKKAVDLKKASDELNQTRVTEQGASTHRLKELEQQLKSANDNLAASKADLEKQNSARQKLETENRSLTEANAKTRTDLDKERIAGKLAQQNAEALEKQAAELKKTIDELNHVRAGEQTASVQSTQRLRELELQLKGATNNLTASGVELEKQNSARQRLESENRTLTETGAKTRADLDKERDAHKISRQESEKLAAQIQKLRQAGEQAEAHACETAAQLKNWEKKAVDLKNALDELNQTRADEQSASAQSLQRLKEQLKGANNSLAESQAEAEKQDSARQRSEAENRKLAEANAKTKADLDKTSAELKKSQRALEQAEARIRLGTDQYCELEEQSVELKKANSNLEKESAEQRSQIESLNNSLGEAQQELEQLSKDANAEIAKFREALELGESERKEMNEELERLRELEERVQREEYMMVDSLRRGLRQPIEDLRQSASGLLEGQLPDKQKRFCETILRNALFLQVFLNASGKNSGEKFPE